MRQHFLIYLILLAWIGSLVIAYRLRYEGAIAEPWFDVIVVAIVLVPLALLLARALRKDRRRRTSRDDR